MNRHLVVRYIWIGIAALIIGLAYGICIPSQVLPYGEGYGISGQSLPKLIAAGLVLSGLLMIANGWRMLKKIQAAGKQAETQPGPLFGKAGLRRMLCYAGVLVVYFLLMERLGFIVSSIPALAAAMWLSGARSRIVIALTSVLAPPLLYLLFSSVMGIPLPRGVLF